MNINGEKTTVSLHKCADYSGENVQRAVDSCLAELGGIEKFVKPGARVLLKPNLLIGRRPDKAVNTHHEVARAVMRRVADCGGEMVVGDSPSIGGAEGAMKKCGIMEAAKQFGAQTLSFRETTEVPSADGHLYKRLLLSKDALNADVVINLPKLKTHGFMTLTLGVKNLFGCIVGRAKPQWHIKAGRNPVAFARMLVEINAAVKPALTIMDGVTAMEGNGPGTGDPKQMNVIMASEDALALDRVAIELVGASPERFPLLQAARQFGLKSQEMENIETTGEPIASLKTESFVLPPPPAGGESFAPPLLLRLFKRGFTSEPKVHHDKCARCGMCVKVCPPQVMSFRRLKKPDKRGDDKRLAIDRSNCIHCFCCQEVCPEGAITIRKGIFLKGARPAEN